MKRIRLLTVLAVTACIACTFGFAACGETHEHKWSAWSVTEAPTAAAAGKAIRTCSGSGDCDAALADKEFALPELTSTDYTLTDNTATCEAAGTATYTYDKNGVSVSFTAASEATGHAYGTTYAYEDESGHWPVCANNTAHTTAKEEHDENGADGACSKCGYTAPVPQHSHDWSDWTLTDENKPTEEQTGKATRTCKNADCDATANYKEYTLPVLTSEDYSKSDDSATCTEAGKITYTYDKDGVSISFDVATPAKHAEQILTVKYPTCTEPGLTEGKKCSVCGEILVEQQPVDPLGHIEGVLAAVTVTCTEDGLTEGKKCSVCQTILEKQNVIAAKGHSLNTTAAPTVNEADKTVSTRCDICNMTIVYEYDDAIDATDATALNSAIALSDGVNYVSQTASVASRPPYLKYTFTEAGTYTIYWMNLNSGAFNLRPATITASTSTAFIDTSGNLKKANIPEDFAIEGYCTSTLQYYITDEDGNQTSTTAQAGDYVVLTKNSLLSSQTQLGLTSFVPVKLTLKVAANTVLSFRNYTNTTDTSYFLVGVNKQPTVVAEVCTVAKGDFSIKDTELEFMPITEETAGTYTFTAETGKFELYVNGSLYSDGEKSYFGYVDLCDRYLTVDLEYGDVVKVVKKFVRASEKIFKIYAEALEEPALPVYTALQLGDQTITLSDTNIAIGKYEDETERFYAFTVNESGYYQISVADDVKVSAVIKVDRARYSFVFDVGNMNKSSGVFYAEEGKTVIIGFVGNDTQDFNVNIASSEEPITYLEANKELENIAFAGFESCVKLTVDDSVAEGTYRLTFTVSNSLLRSYIYFAVGEEIEIDDPYDSNAVAAYVNSDIAAGANNTVGAGTSDNSDWDDDFSRTITVKAGDVIYLYTTALIPGCVSITLTPVA